MKRCRFSIFVWPAAAVLVAWCSTLSQAFAVAENWQVGKVSGTAWVDVGPGSHTDLTLGMDVPPGVTIFTGDRSRLLLVRGTESMVLGPKSIIAVSEHPTEGLSTTILEKAGSVAFDVERENVKHFSVETPMLAAVVKGTHFTVNVARADGRVSVGRGTVEVTALATGQTADVTIGQRASVGRNGLSISGAGARSGITVGAPRPAMVSAVAPGVPTVSMFNALTTAEMTAVASVTATTAAESGVAMGSFSPAMSHADGPAHSSATSSPGNTRSMVSASSASATTAGSMASSSSNAASAAGVAAGSTQAGIGVSASSATQAAGNTMTTVSNNASVAGPSAATSQAAGASTMSAVSPPSISPASSNDKGGLGNSATKSNGGFSVSISHDHGGASVSVSAGGVTSTVGIGNQASRTGVTKSDNGKGNQGTPGAGLGTRR